MEAVLFDLYLSDAELKENNTQYKENPEQKTKLLAKTHEKHNITPESLEKSLSHYAANLDKYVKINESISEKYAQLITNTKRELSDSIAQRELRKSTENNPRIDQRNFFIFPFDLSENTYRFISDTTCKMEEGNYTVSLKMFGISNSANAGINLQIDCQDTIIVLKDTIKVNGCYSKSVNIPPSKHSKSVKGEFRFHKINPNMLIYVADLNIRKNQSK
jgi:hypothetical protein